MLRDWLAGLPHKLACSCVVVLASAGVSLAGENDADLRALIEQQGKQIEELKQQVQSQAAPGAPALDDQAVKRIVADFLKDNPGAGMPPSVQTGYSTATGFTIRSYNNPPYVAWQDDCKIPFELRIRGRLQLDYYFYKVTDSVNHQLGIDQKHNTSPDFSQLEVKRTRFIFEGTAFDPNFRYHLELDGNTRGLGALGGGGVPAGNGTNNSGGVPGVPDGNGVATVDHAVRLFSAYVAYDFHGCASEKGCGADCPAGTYKYAPTYSLIFGKLKPFMSYEEYLGSGNEQFVEYGMSEWFFDADDDNLLMGAGFQIKAFDDRLYVQGLITNGNETQIANLQMDDLPGFSIGGWYDFGGTWNNERKRWDLCGDSISDIDYSTCPVLRVGGAANIVPMDRRSLFTNAELNRPFALNAAPGGTRFLNILNGGSGAVVPGGAVNGVGQFAVDRFNSYTFEAFIHGKWKGFSIMNDWWVRDLNNFTGRKFPTGAYPGNGHNQPILYGVNLVDTTNVPNNGLNQNALFPNHAILDYGTMVQGGYFIVPKKWEICGRWSWLRGESGDIRGDGSKPTALTAAQVKALGLPAGSNVLVVPGAFRTFSEAQEYAVGVNYYWKRQQAKWQLDFSIYNGGNPAGGGQSPAGFIPGVDGWMLRTQIQFAF
jgi:hypothetical protein